MTKSAKRVGLTSRSFLFAVLIHLALLALLGVSLHWKSPVIKPGVVKPIQAQAIPETQIQQQVAELERREQQKIDEEQAAQQRLEELEQKRLQEEERLRQVEEQRKQEEQKKVEAEQQRIEEEKKRVAEEKQRKEAEVKKQAEEKKRKEEQAKQERLEKERRQKEEAERKKKEEAERKKREAAERKKKEEAERKRKAEQAAQQKREQELQKRLAQEKLQGEAIRALGEVDWRIKEAIERNWNRPASSQTGLVAAVLIRVTANGDVIDARVTRSSGDPYFDRSAEVAVKKASPLPLPTDPRYRDIYQKESIEILFKPDG